MKIVDPVLYPYEISLDGSNFTVEEVTDKVNSKQEIVYKNHGYFSSLESALSKIISLKLLGMKTESTLLEYIKGYKRIKDDIKQSIGF